MKLLCLSNGHGEDEIALRILEQLQDKLQDKISIAALPIVGQGYSYIKANIPIIGKVQQMPSGGFIYMDGKQLYRDLKGGLLQLTLTQYKAMNQWVKSQRKQSKEKVVILAVGDIVPLIFAYLSGVDYAFVGTAKSEYYLRDEMGWLPQTSKLEKWLGSVYLPWERWLMTRKYCKAVFPRDGLTTEILKQWSIPAHNLGNPMMDNLEILPSEVVIQDDTVKEQEEKKRQLTILLLPGSRMPEASENWQLIMRGVRNIISSFSERSLLFLAAIAPALDITNFTQNLDNEGWLPQKLDKISINLNDSEVLVYNQKNANLIISQNCYRECLNEADLAIAMAGTATEQFVGLGKPALILPGNGPQFTYAFAEAQTRLLGPSLIMAKQPKDLPDMIKALLQDPDRIQLIAENGRTRMGKSGASDRIATYITEIFFNS